MPRPTGGGSQPFSSSRSSRQKVNRKHKQRGLNAFAIASASAPDKLDVKKHRLGEAEPDEGPSRKRRRPEDGSDDDEEDGEEEDEDEEPRRKQAKRGTDDDLDISEGSDDEGNRWRLGHVDRDDDEEIDSDEAFDESDEERYEGFTFRGSSTNKKKPVKKSLKRAGATGLDESDEDEEEDGDDDSLGEDAVDLATMLDDEYASESVHSEDGEKKASRKSAPAKPSSRSKTNRAEEEEDDDDDEDEEEEEEDVSSDGDESDAFGFSEEDDDDLDDASKLEQLQNLVSSLPQQGDVDEEDEEQTAQANRSRLLGALKGMANLDPAFSRSAKKLAQGSAATATGDNDKLVKAPLPKRQQDRIDRAAAYSKAKETLNRWIDTVKANRRAEHLSFPLRDPDAQEPAGTSKLLHTGDNQPRNELENAIQTILEESGLTSKSAMPGDAQINHFEELKSKELPLAELMARRAELRKQRELLFREEIRAKRVKKIKSKAYRRVHRKEKERAAEKEKELLLANGEYDSEEDRERNDRRRAEERMGARHRESKWAKGVKATGRPAWDEDARGGMVDMARRNDELRQRVEGRRVHTSDQSSAEDSSDDEDGEDEGAFQLRDALDKMDAEPTTESRLGAMKFMQKADAARKRQNDEAVAALRRELGEGGDEESEQDSAVPIGRRIFGPSSQTQPEATPAPKPRAELEEASDSDQDDAPLIQPGKDILEAEERKTQPKGAVKSAPQQLSRAFAAEIGVAGKVAAKGAGKGQALVVQPAGDGVVVVKSNGKTDKRVPDPEDGDFLEPSNLAIIQAAFGGDEVETEFAKEKLDAAEDEDDKFVDESLPGWGSWAGEGVQAPKRGTLAKRLKKKQEGVKAANRKDANLDRVIISEKRVKKNSKYLAPQLPHPFESKQQYERSLRIPIGPEWTTKETFQKSTKPRVMVKQGIIRPMDKPLV